MQRKMIVLVMGLFLLIMGGTGVAMGADQQVVGQEAGSSQAASSAATSTQTNPSNQNIDVRIFSPGDAGAVTQTNSSAAASAAANANATDQSAQQQQAGGGSATQAVGQDAASTQTAGSQATSTQTNPSNSNISVRIDSPGNGGPVDQSNTSTAASGAANLNAAKQSSTQQQSGGACCTGGGTQAAGQAASNDQTATSDATSTQTKPSNTNIGVRIGSPGNDGAVTQSNTSAAGSVAGNANLTGQSATQQQAGGYYAPSTERVQPSSCCSSGTGVQAVGQFADSSQTATSAATSTQDHPSNSNTPVRIGSSGDDGAVTQTNASVAVSGAGNLNLTDQSATQTQAGGLGTGVQAIGQKAGNYQDADSSASSTQSGASNTNAPVRIFSPGGGGTVEQTNGSVALSGAGNANATNQSATQTQGGGGCCGYGTGVQAIGQKAWSSQTANSTANSAQYHPSNTNAPVRIASEGYDGAVTQTNGSLAASAAGNLNATHQSATQQQAGGYYAPMPLRASQCCYGGTGVQAIGQFAYNRQSASSTADSTQSGASNTNAPVRIFSPGGGGSVSQSNDSLAASLAFNLNWLGQTASQQQGGVI